MRTFVIFDRKTGSILQTHVQSGDMHGGMEQLLEGVRPESKNEDVDIMAVEGLSPGAGYRVDVKTKKLARIEKSEAPGSGDAYIQLEGGESGPEQTILFPVKQREP